jgi:hypothetical protein
MECLSINIEPPYNAFAHPYIVVPFLFHDKSSNFEIFPIHFIWMLEDTN